MSQWVRMLSTSPACWLQGTGSLAPLIAVGQGRSAED